MMSVSTSRPPSRPWTPAEESRLYELLEADRTAAEIAIELNRTPVAIYARLQRLYRKRATGDVSHSLGRRAR